MKRVLVILAILVMILSMQWSIALADSPLDYDHQEKGLKLSVGGAGLKYTSDPADLTVNIGGEIQYAVLSWIGRTEGFCTTDCGGDVLLFDGNAVAGELIGTEYPISPSLFDITAVGHAADVTTYLQGIYSVPNDYTFSVQKADADPTYGFDGAALWVVYLDPADPDTLTTNNVQIKLVTDYGYRGFSGDAQVIDPVPFTINAGVNARDAKYFLAVGDAEPGRPDIIDIDGTQYWNDLASFDGIEMDTPEIVQTIPPGVIETVVELISDNNDELPTQQPDSLKLLGVGLELPVLSPTAITLTSLNVSSNSINMTAIYFAVMVLLGAIALGTFRWMRSQKVRA